MSGTEEFLYRLKTVRPDLAVTGPDPEEARVLEEHVAYLTDLTDRGVLVLAGRTQEQGEETFGIVVFRAGSTEAARQIVQADPAVRDGVMVAELFPFRVAFGPSAPHPGE